MGEPPHAGDRRGRSEAVGPGRRLEHVAVGLPERLGGLLAGEPRQPRRQAAGAVGAGPAEDAPRPRRTRVPGVELDDRVPAAGARVVGEVGRAERGAGAPDLVVADQADLPAPRERRHAVVGRGGGQPVGHRAADVAERPVLEAGRQRQQLLARGVVGHRSDRAVAGVAATMPTSVLGGGARGTGGEGLQRPGQGERARTCGRGLQERASIDSGHRTSRKGRCVRNGTSMRNVTTAPDRPVRRRRTAIERSGAIRGGTDPHQGRGRVRQAAGRRKRPGVVPTCRRK